MNNQYMNFANQYGMNIPNMPPYMDIIQNDNL